MPTFHHVNLGVPTGGLEAESSWLVDVLGFKRLDPGADLAARGATWFEGDDGGQIHLSVDPDHRAPDRAHVAFELGPLLRRQSPELDDLHVRMQPQRQREVTPLTVRLILRPRLRTRRAAQT